jgi:DNA-binding response OmpR family regulator
MANILIIDEDTEVLRLLRLKLTAAGYEISRARDGAEALELARETRPDIVITELLLPDIDGAELIQRLRAAAQPPLVLVLSGKTADEAIAAALAAGAADYICKPFSPQGLLERIRVNLIRTSQAEIVNRGH